MTKTDLQKLRLNDFRDLLQESKDDHWSVISNGCQQVDMAMESIQMALDELIEFADQALKDRLCQKGVEE